MSSRSRLAAPLVDRWAPVSFRMTVARAADGPAPTLVVDLTTAPLWMTDEEARARLMEARRVGMVTLPGTGAKTIAVLPSEKDVVRLLFVQGVGDEVDPDVGVCVNSASAALAVARNVWHLISDGPIRVEMGTAEFCFREVA